MLRSVNATGRLYRVTRVFFFVVVGAVGDLYLLAVCCHTRSRRYEMVCIGTYVNVSRRRRRPRNGV